MVYYLFKAWFDNEEKVRMSYLSSAGDWGVVPGESDGDRDCQFTAQHARAVHSQVRGPEGRAGGRTGGGRTDRPKGEGRRAYTTYCQYDEWSIWRMVNMMAGRCDGWSMWRMVNVTDGQCDGWSMWQIVNMMNGQYSGMPTRLTDDTQWTDDMTDVQYNRKL